MDIKFINAPFNRIGAKNYSKKFIISHFPQKESYKIYIEPFMGAGNILLNAPQVDIMIGNDTDKNVINAFKTIKKITKKDIENYNFISKINKRQFEKIKNIYKNNLETNSKERFLNYIYLLGNSYLGKRTNFSNERNYKAFRLKNNLDIIQERLKHIKITNLDYKIIIEKCDSKETFFYIDPPYMDTYNNYQTGNINHLELSNILKNIKGKFLMSHNDTAKIKKLYKGFKFIKYSVSQNLKGSVVNELLIKNY